MSIYKMKHCNGCDKDLPLTSFHKRKKAKDGRVSRCITCKSNYNLNRRINRPDREAHNKKRAEITRKQRRKYPELSLINNCKQRARERGLEINIKKSDIIIPAFCPILGIPIIPRGNNKGFSDNSPSVDRIDNTRGYTKDNIMIISWRANRIKSDSSINELKKIYYFYKKLLLWIYLYWMKIPENVPSTTLMPI